MIVPEKKVFVMAARLCLSRCVIAHCMLSVLHKEFGGHAVKKS